MGATRLLGGLLMSLVACGAAASVVLLAVSDSALMAGNVQRALALNPLSSEALSLSSEAAFSKGDIRTAERLARSAVQAATFNVDAVVRLARIKKDMGAGLAAEELMRAAASLGWRHPELQRWSVAEALKHGDIERGLDHADALLRQGFDVDEMLALVRDSAKHPGAVALVAAKLASNPGWRWRFMAARTLDERHYDAQERILTALKGSKAPPSPEEVVPYLSGLIAKQDFARAHRLWRRLFESEDEASFVSDGGFRRWAKAARSSSPFEWKANAVAGAYAVSDPPPGATREVMRVQADGSAAGRVIEQLLVLPPGEYVMTVRGGGVEAEPFESLRWDAQCVGGDGRLALLPSSSRVAAGEHLESFRLRVTGADCPAQRLELHVGHAGPGKLDAWFSEVTVRTAS